MMKVAVTSDWHIDTVTAGVERFGEVERLVAELTRWGLDNPDAVLLVLGDYFDPGHRRDLERATWLIETARYLGGHFRKSIWLAGNHDVIETSRLTTVLSPLRAAVGEAGSIVVSERPELISLTGQDPYRSNAAGVVVLTLPFVASAARAEDRLPPVALLRDGLELGATRHVVVAGHRTVPGVVPGTETIEMPRGGDHPIPEEVLQLAREFPDRVTVVNGHYHEPQRFIHAGVSIFIPGAPYRVTFGELGGDPRGFIVLNLPGEVA